MAAGARNACRVVAVLAALAGAVAGGASAAAAPACFGAAARDPQHPCANALLSRSVVPDPLIAEITPGEPCLPVEQFGYVEVCAFGAPPAAATGTIAIVGDSHAMHWRAAVAVVARDEHWYGVSITRSHCPLSMAVKELPEPDQAGCLQWRRDVFRWFAAHPEVTTVVLGQLTSRIPVLTPPWETEFRAEMTGYEQAWTALPASVQHIVVIRDTPRAPPHTRSCVTRAIARHQAAGRPCEGPRRGRLRPDAAAAAAAERHSPRVRLLDFTPFFCAPRHCFSVIGGVLVYKDGHHMTRVFATTLGPFLERGLEDLGIAPVRGPAGSRS